MTKTEFKAMTLDELIDWAYENTDDVTTEARLLDLAEANIEDDLSLSAHILTAIQEGGKSYKGYYRYNYSLGIFETPTPITCKEDLEDLIDFDEEEEDED